MYIQSSSNSPSQHDLSLMLLGNALMPLSSWKTANDSVLNHKILSEQERIQLASTEAKISGEQLWIKSSSLGEPYFQFNYNITAIWRNKENNFQPDNETSFLETNSSLYSANHPGTKSYVKEMIGDKLYSSLDDKDKQFLSEASNMFNMGNDVDIKNILNLLNENIE